MSITTVDNRTIAACAIEEGITSEYATTLLRHPQATTDFVLATLAEELVSFYFDLGALLGSVPQHEGTAWYQRCLALQQQADAVYDELLAEDEAWPSEYAD